MSAGATTEAQLGGVGTESAGLHHFVCCDDNVALCGTDVSMEPWAEDGDVCVACADLDDTICPRCGE